MNTSLVDPLTLPTAGSAANAPARASVLVYGARDETFWSGSPWYFAAALREFGLGAESKFDVVNLGPRRLREVPFTFAQWALQYKSLRDRLFLSSPEYHDRSFPSRKDIPEGATALVSFAQILPRAFREHKHLNPGFRIVQYIDVTLRELLERFDYAKNPPEEVLVSMLAAEHASYHLADRIMVFHEGNADVLVSQYGVPREKISVEGRGVNLSRNVVNQIGGVQRRRRSDADFNNGNPSALAACSGGGSASGSGNNSERRAQPLRMCIVGKGPRRKGVFALIEAIDALSAAEQTQIELLVIGPEVSELPKRPYLRALGFVPASARVELAHTMRDCHLGVLLSEAEGHPGSIWEFLTLGVPVWVTTLPHIEDELGGFPAMFEPLPVRHESLVSRLQSLLRDPDQLDRLKAERTRDIRDLTWWRPAASVGQFLTQGR